jgi:hypothetical protein
MIAEACTLAPHLHVDRQPHVARKPKKSGRRESNPHDQLGSRGASLRYHLHVR